MKQNEKHQQQKKKKKNVDRWGSLRDSHDIELIYIGKMKKKKRGKLTKWPYRDNAKANLIRIYRIASHKTTNKEGRLI